MVSQNKKTHFGFQEIEEHEMPLSNYGLMHGDMSEEDRKKLGDWFKSI